MEILSAKLIKKICNFLITNVLQDNMLHLACNKVLEMICHPILRPSERRAWQDLQRWEDFALENLIPMLVTRIQGLRYRVFPVPFFTMQFDSLEFNLIRNKLSREIFRCNPGVQYLIILFFFSNLFKFVLNFVHQLLIFMDLYIYFPSNQMRQRVHS